MVSKLVLDATIMYFGGHFIHLHFGCLIFDFVNVNEM